MQTFADDDYYQNSKHCHFLLDFIRMELTTYLEYENLKDLLSVILYTSHSFMSITPLLYHITYQDKEILFIHTGIVGGIVAHYHILNEKPNKKFRSWVWS
ncbi:MAG: hypothetical protein WA364_05845 [Candidatus Nitrosopolaris sp.]